MIIKYHLQGKTLNTYKDLLSYKTYRDIIFIIIILLLFYSSYRACEVAVRLNLIN